MDNLISLELAKKHLKLDYYNPDGSLVENTSEDALIELYIKSASAWVQEHISVEYAEGDEVPTPVAAACLLMVGESYARRESAVVGTIYSDTKTLERLLQPYRKGLTVY